MRCAAMVAACLGLAATAAAAPATVLRMTAEGHTMFNGMAFVGPASFVFNGAATQATASTVLLQQRDLPNGMVLAITSHTFDFGNGNTLVTLDHVRLFPTATPGLYEIDSQLNLVDGTGIFENAAGHFVGGRGATINLVTGQADWTLSGTVTVRP